LGLLPKIENHKSTMQLPKFDNLGTCIRLGYLSKKKMSHTPPSPGEKWEFQH